MGTTVQMLDGALIDQIAAGEVIERPANLVKELVENAIDAEATAIWVSIEDGGRALVRVRDDGIGMSRADAELSIARHATSKIRSFDDLVRVQTLGFRGEALPSIGAVARMSIATRRPHDTEGTRVVVEGGRVTGVEPCGCPGGTTVEVEDLFYNVPARKKFLRARQTETSKIMEICQRTALIHPELRLEASSEGRTTRAFAPVASLRARAVQAFGDLSFDEVVAERDGLALHAVLSPPETARPGARHLFLYVNDRPIVDRRVAHAVAFAYGDRLPRGHYPRGIVSLRLPVEDVDVNAHPQKTEVRFRHGSRVLDSLTRVLGGRLRLDASGTHPRPQGPEATRVTPWRGDDSQTSNTSQIRLSETPTPYEPTTTSGGPLLAQLRDRYLLCDQCGRVWLVDRARAAAALALESMQQLATRGPLPPQALLFPDRLEVEVRHQEVLERHEDLLLSLGFEWSRIGETSFVLRAVPAALGAAPARTVFLNALTALGANPTPGKNEILALLAEATAPSPGALVSHAEASVLAARLDFERPAHRACVVADLTVPVAHESDS
ncbi:MAG: DNA mismatch repair endonuclease MutL [Myxococcota bacterium]